MLERLRGLAGLAAALIWLLVVVAFGNFLVGLLAWAVVLVFI